jgi:hypothetical protein
MIVTRRPAMSAVTALLGAGLVLAGCGGGSAAPSSASRSSEAPKQLFDQAIGAMTKAKSARLKGDLAETPTQSISLDLSLYKNGDASGTFGLSGSTGKMVVAAGTAYLNGSTAFWRALATTSGASVSSAEEAEFAALSGKWVETSTSSLNLGTFSLSGLTASLKAHRVISKVGARTVDGHAAIGIKGSKQGVLWIASTGTPYPIELSKTSSPTSESVSFSGWNAQPPVKVPKGARSITSILGG